MDEIEFFCSKDCPDTCSFYYSNINNKFSTKHKRDFVCSKLKGFYNREILNNNDQSFYTIGEKRVYKNVLYELADFLKQNSDKRILFYRGSGSLGYYMGYWDKLFSNFENCYFVKGNPCDETGIIGHIEDFGKCVNPPVENLENVESIILFGKNAYTTSPHLFVYLRSLAKKGKKIVYIDPIESQTSIIADRYIQINPSTDALFVYELLSRMKYEKQKDGLLDEIGINKDDIDYMLNLIQDNKTAIIEGAGLQRYSNGKNNIQWINRLAYHTNNIDNLYYSRSSKEGIEPIRIKKKNIINIAEIPDYLDKDFFDVIVIVASNPVVTMPQNNLWVNALKKSKSIIVDTNITKTAEHADFFIKVGGMFAQDEIQGSYFFRKTNIRKKAVKGVDSDIDVIKKLSKALNVDINIPPVESIHFEDVPYKRDYIYHNLDLIKPYSEKGRIRIITLSHSRYLNSQTEMTDKEIIYISKQVSEKYGIYDTQEVTIENGLGSFSVICKISDKIQGNSAFAYKNRNSTLNALTKSRNTDAGYALAYYDMFVNLSL